MDTLETESQMPAWAEDMEQCRTLAKRLLEELDVALGSGVAETETQRWKEIFGAKESVAGALVMMGTFLLKLHGFGDAQEKAGGMEDAESIQPEDTLIMEDYVTRPRLTGS